MGDFRLLVMKRIYFIFFFTLVKTVCSGLGKCPVFPPLQGFDIGRMSGKWYEVERSFYIMEMTASCTEVDVTINERGHLLITAYTVNRWTGNPSVTYGLGIPSHNGSSTFRYKLNNRMPYVIGRMLPGAGQYNILFTDYDSIALVWSCSSVSVAHTDRMWVLARKREISAALRAQVYAVMTDLRLDPDRLILTKHQDCHGIRPVPLM